jgi:hypothetical protein
VCATSSKQWQSLWLMLSLGLKPERMQCELSATPVYAGSPSYGRVCYVYGALTMNPAISPLNELN